MNTYTYNGLQIDSIDLKCLIVSRGLKVDNAVYRRFSGTFRLSKNPLECNCLILSDGTVVQLTDVGFHLKYLSGILSWNNLKLLRYASQLGTPFSLQLTDDRAALFHEDDFLDYVSFPPATDFYAMRTPNGISHRGNAVLQGLDWVAFQCLWPCEYAAGGKPCEFCFSGADHEVLARKGRALPSPVPAEDVREIVRYAVQEVGMGAVQITGGSTFEGKNESGNILAYLGALAEIPDLDGDSGAYAAGTAGKAGTVGKLDECLLYITPPEDFGLIDAYFDLGASRIACSIEVWDEEKAKVVTPGKMAFTTRARHMDALSFIADRYGPDRAFSNFIIGIESFETLRIGAEEMAKRGILPAASVWMPMGRPVLGSMTPPDVDYYRRVKEWFGELYERYGLRPPDSRGLNVCIETDIARYYPGTKQ